MQLISIITPMYNEEEIISQYFSRVNDLINRVKQERKDLAFEIVIVNDGSKDETFEKLQARLEIQHNLRIVNLSRNFGQEASIFAGIENAKGDALIVMDADMQDPPELITQMIEKWKEGYDVVNAKRTDRTSDSFFKRWTAKFYYKVINILSYRIKYPENVNNFRLISKRVAEIINRFPSNEKLFRNAVTQSGFKTAEVGFVRAKRIGGKPKINKKSLMQLAFQGISDSTVKPLHWGFGWSILSLICGGIFLLTSLVFVILADFANVAWVNFFTNTMLFNWCVIGSFFLVFSGIILFHLSVNSYYLGNAYTELKGRPMYIVERICENADKTL